MVVTFGEIYIESTSRSCRVLGECKVLHKTHYAVHCKQYTDYIAKNIVKNILNTIHITQTTASRQNTREDINMDIVILLAG